MKQGSYLERLCEAIIRDEGLPTPLREFRFCDGRFWRSDFVWVEQKVILECEGGIWCRGRHISPRGFLKDIEKYNTATLMGYKVIRIAKEHIDNGMIVEWLHKALDGK